MLCYMLVPPWADLTPNNWQCYCPCQGFSTLLPCTGIAPHSVVFPSPSKKVQVMSVSFFSKFHKCVFVPYCHLLYISLQCATINCSHLCSSSSKGVRVKDIIVSKMSAEATVLGVIIFWDKNSWICEQKWLSESWIDMSTCFSSEYCHAQHGCYSTTLQ